MIFWNERNYYKQYNYRKRNRVGWNIDMKEPNTKEGPLRKSPFVWFGEITDSPESMKAGHETTLSPPAPFPLPTE